MEREEPEEEEAEVVMVGLVGIVPATEEAYGLGLVRILLEEGEGMLPAELIPEVDEDVGWAILDKVLLPEDRPCP